MVRTILSVQSDTEGSRKPLIGRCFPISPNDQGHNSFGGAPVKGIEGSSTPGQRNVGCKSHLREAFDVSFSKSKDEISNASRPAISSTGSFADQRIWCVWLRLSAVS